MSMRSLILFAACFCMMACKQFRVNQVNGVNMLLPPATDVSQKSGSNLKYQDVFIGGINENYLSTLQAIDRAEYVHHGESRKNNYLIGYMAGYSDYVRIAEFVTKNGVRITVARKGRVATRGLEGSSSTDLTLTKELEKSNELKRIGLTELNASLLDTVRIFSHAGSVVESSSVASTRGSEYAIKVEINYDLLLQGKLTKSHFTNMATDVIVTLSAFENKYYKWPGSISLNIAEKVFELLPVPTDAVLSRFGFRQDSVSIIPLNPKIQLRVEHSIKYEDRDNGSFRYEPSGQSTISFSRIQYNDNEKSVLYKFDPFIKDLSDRSLAQHNQYGTGRLLASSIDPEFTVEIARCDYLFLFQMYLRSTTSEAGADEPVGSCCNGPNGITCNTLLFYRSDPKVLKEGFKCDKLGDYATWGERGVVMPMINIEINSSLVSVPLGTSIRDLIASGKLNSRFSLTRPYRGKDVDIKDVVTDLLLLPGDNLNDH